MRPSSRSVVPMSFRSGTFCSVMESAVSRLAHRIGSAAFLAPDTVISPFRGLPPMIWILSIRLRLVFGGRQGVPGTGVDFVFPEFAHSNIFKLLERYTTLAL